MYYESRRLSHLVGRYFYGSHWCYMVNGYLIDLSRIPNMIISDAREITSKATPQQADLFQLDTVLNQLKFVG